MKSLSPEELSIGNFIATKTFVRGDNPDLGSYLIVARSIVQSAMASAQENGELADDYKEAARKTSYNIGAETWPGWVDMAVSGEQLAMGLESAELTLSLSLELNQPPGLLENAYWILAAHLLAAGDTVKARSAFEKCQELIIEDRGEPAPPVEAWALLCDAVGGKAEAIGEFDRLVDRIERDGDPAQKVGYLRKAKDVFLA